VRDENIFKVGELVWMRNLYQGWHQGIITKFTTDLHNKAGRALIQVRKRDSQKQVSWYDEKSAQHYDKVMALDASRMELKKSLAENKIETCRHQLLKFNLHEFQVSK
jgi:hypothetical protein